MWLDIIGVVFIVYYFIRGYSKGLIVAVLSMLALLLGIVVTLSLSHPFAEWIAHKGILDSGKALVVSYIVLFIGVLVLVRVLANLLQKAAQALMLGGANAVLGGLLYALLGAMLWSILLWVCIPLHVISSSTIAESKTYHYISGLAPWFFKSVSNILPFASDAYNNFDHFLKNQ